jgi:hypothetical protein
MTQKHEREPTKSANRFEAQHKNNSGSSPTAQILCDTLFAIFREVRHVSRKLNQREKSTQNTIKTAMKREFHGRKLVAGAGFEPTTFRL